MHEGKSSISIKWEVSPFSSSNHSGPWRRIFTKEHKEAVTSVLAMSPTNPIAAPCTDALCPTSKIFSG